MSDVTTLPVLVLTATLSVGQSNAASNTVSSVYVPRFQSGAAETRVRISPELIRARQATTGEYVSDQAADELEVRFSPHFRKLAQLRSDSALWVDGSEPPASVALALASGVLNKLYELEYEPTKIVASAEGGVAICFVSGDKYADIECFNTGSVLSVVSNRRDRPVVWTVGQSQSDVAFAVHRIRGFFEQQEAKADGAQRSPRRGWFSAFRPAVS